MINIKPNSTKEKSSYFRQLITIFIFLAVFSSGFIIGSVHDKEVKICAEEEDNFLGAEFNLFWETLYHLRNKYKNFSEIEPQELIYGATKGLVGALKDPYSEFLRPEVSKRFIEDIKGSFEGIGAEIGIKNGVLTVIAPLEGTPAQKAGLRTNDKIIKIDGQITLDLSVEEAVGLIRGPKGSKVRLTVLSGDEQKDIVIQRGTIVVPVIKWETMEDGKIAYIRIFNFTENSPKEFSKIIQPILSSKSEKLILDLRGNPGGYLDAAVTIAGWFLEKDAVVVIEEKKGGEQKVYQSDGSGVFGHWPMVVLIDEGSASASEILAGALRDNLGVTLLGTKSFGKGSVQEMISLSKGASLKLTIADWLTPEGTSISKFGLEPDIEEQLNLENYKQGEDNQIKRAIEYLNNQTK